MCKNDLYKDTILTISKFSKARDVMAQYAANHTSTKKNLSVFFKGRKLKPNDTFENFKSGKYFIMSTLEQTQQHKQDKLRRDTGAQYTIRVSNRDNIQAKLKDSGIPTAVHYPVSLHLQECFQYLNYKQGDFPISEQASKEVLSLPMNPFLSNKEIEYITSRLI